MPGIFFYYIKVWYQNYSESLKVVAPFYCNMTRNTHPKGIDVIAMSEQYDTHDDIPSWKVKRIAIQISHSDIDSKILLEE